MNPQQQEWQNLVERHNWRELVAQIGAVEQELRAPAPADRKRVEELQRREKQLRTAIAFLVRRQ